jgi:hypothetical protein
MPDFKAFIEERALPSAERGPVEALGCLDFFILAFEMEKAGSRTRGQSGGPPMLVSMYY